MERKEIKKLLTKYKQLMRVVYSGKNYWDKKDDLLDKWSDLNNYVFRLSHFYGDNEKLEKIANYIEKMDLKMEYRWDIRKFMDLENEIKDLGGKYEK